MTEHEIETATFVVPDHVVFRDFAAETVVLNLETGQYHGLNPTAGRMLELISTGATPLETAETVSAQFGRPRGEILPDLVALVQQLTERGILTATPSAPSQ